jgi:ABC-type dipeptide/oligopeptide/nickel transport system ATPase component
LELAPGEIVGILGESGSGKSTLALSILGLLPKTTQVSGSVCVHGEELLNCGEAQLRKIRGAKVSLIHQEPGLALSPVMRVGDQIGQVLRAHGTDSRQARREKIEEILTAVHFTDIRRIVRAYPHELSGGELHRAAIAQALICRPELAIADEPNRSLDVGLQLDLLKLLREFNQKFGTALLFITHNPMLLAGFADRVIVMRCGKVVEQGRIAEVFRRPADAYTRLLLQYVPRPLSNGNRAISELPAELLPR